MNPRSRPIGEWLGACAVALMLVPAPLHAVVASASASDDGVLEVTESLPPSGPALLGVGNLDFRFTLAGFDEVAFTGTTLPLPSFPGSLLLPVSPFGPLALLADPAQPGDYLLYVADVSLSLPLSWDASDNTFDGSNGTLSVSVEETPVWETPQEDTVQGPGGGPSVNICVSEVERPGGRKGIRIEVEHDPECTVRFQQFFVSKITWKGTRGGVPDTGTCGLPLGGTGNNKHPTINDGKRVYTDSQAPDGSYPAKDPVPGPVSGTTTTAMEDAPKLKEADALKTLIMLDSVQDPDSPGPITDITEIRYEIRYTTYVLLTCPPAAERIVGRVNWTYVQVYTFPAPAGGQDPGKYGGPDPVKPDCGFPLGTPHVDQQEPMSMWTDHQLTLQDYIDKGYNGVPTPDWF